MIERGNQIRKDDIVYGYVIENENGNAAYSAPCQAEEGKCVI